MAADSAAPDYAASTAVLVGVSAYQDPAYQDPGHSRLVAAGNSLTAVHGILSDPELCGWPPDRIVTIADPSSAAELAVRLKEIARRTTDTLLLFYVGHGELTATGELVLTVTSTRADDFKETGLRYDLVRDAFNASAARMKVAFLDCCGSGRAIPTVLGPATLARRAAVEGTYIVTAATGNSDAHRPPAADAPTAPTSFTRALTTVTRRGVPGKPDWLTLPDLFPEVAAWLLERGLPEPGQAVSATATQFPFTRNAAPPETCADPVADLPYDVGAAPPAGASGRRRTYYEETTGMRWGGRLFMSAGPVAFSVTGAVTSAENWSTEPVQVLAYAAVFVLTAAWFFLSPLLHRFRVTDRVLQLGWRRSHPWPLIGRIARIGAYVVVDGEATPRTRPCPHCGELAPVHATVLEIYDTNGDRIDGVNLDRFAQPVCPCRRREGSYGPRFDVPASVNLRALGDDWRLFGLVVRALAPHVVIEDHDPVSV